MLVRLMQQAAERPDATAIEWRDGRLSYAGLLRRVDEAMAFIEAQDAGALGLHLDNGPDWVAFDLAALALGRVTVPLPSFFSTRQLRHVAEAAGLEAIVTDRPQTLHAAFEGRMAGTHQMIDDGLSGLCWLPVERQKAPPNPMAPGVCKVTFTSGTTGTPKGVLLDWLQIHAVTGSLVHAVGLGPGDRHLALLPLAVLLENIAGLYAPLWAGATVVLAPLADMGMRGAVGVDGERLADVLARYGASTAIFTPQSLQALVEACERGIKASPGLRFAAVGGASVSPLLLERAAAIGLPVFEGYGLSECASVVCLNTPGAHRPGRVGRPLPHLDLEIADDGEVLIHRSGFRGYLGDPAPNGPWHTGDLGELDAEGFLRVFGRRRHVFITASGRNVSPEWVERELLPEAAIAQVAVFGEARPFNVAVVHPSAGASIGDVAQAIRRANRSLPDYAQIGRWITAAEPFTPQNGLLTGNGRVRREHVWSRYAAALESLYREAVSS
jgi:long-subunit acyl-CoA synthetase (AMP-forming)